MAVNRILFRADGSSTIGMGHFVRTLSLAQMLRNDFLCVFYLHKPSQYQIQELEQSKIECIELTSTNFFDEFLNLIDSKDIIVLDNYFYTTEYQIQIKNRAYKLVCIDDIHDKHYVADVIINQAEGISESNFSKEVYTKCLLGYKYSLLRKEFIQNSKTHTGSTYFCSIMIGGSDPFDISSKLVSLLNMSISNKPIAIITNNKITLDTFDNNPRFRLFTNISAKELINTMLTSEFCILPASTSAIEACAIRVPFICGHFVDNQQKSYTSIQKQQVAICVDSFNTISKETLNQAIESILDKKVIEQLKEMQIKMIDKQSQERICNEFKMLCN